MSGSEIRPSSTSTPDSIAVPRFCRGKAGARMLMNPNHQCATGATTASSQVHEKGAPLPLHQIEGNAVFSRRWRPHRHPPRKRRADWPCRPSVLAISASAPIKPRSADDHESPFSRLELGYGWDRLGLGDLPELWRGLCRGGYSGRIQSNCTISMRVSNCQRR